MNKVLKIIMLVVGMTTSFLSSSQTELGLLPYSNNLLLNPSFAGFNRSTSVWSNLVFFSHAPLNINHSFNVTYDTWLEKTKTGTAFYFYQGLKGKLNTVHTGAGFTLTRPIEINKGKLIPSVNLSYLIYTKQWLVYFLDNGLDLEEDINGNPVYQQPGDKFMLYKDFIPRLGLLWDSPFLTLGVSASRYHKFEQDRLIPKAHITMHATQKMRGRQKGLQSRPFQASPELILLISDNLLLSRAGFRMEQVTSQLAFFIQNNFTQNHHGLAGVIGWRLGDIHINMTAGGAYLIPEKRTAFFGEISLGYVLPYQFSNLQNPWAPPAKTF